MAEEKASKPFYKSKVFLGVVLGLVGIFVVGSLISLYTGSFVRTETTSVKTPKTSCTDECFESGNYCEGNNNIYSCSDNDADGCKERTYVTTCSDGEMCSNGICQREKLELGTIYGELDSCLIKKEEQISGLAIVIPPSIEGLDYFNKRGGLTNLGFELKQGVLKYDDVFKIEAKMLDKSGRTVATNDGTIKRQNLAGWSVCEKCYSLGSWISLPYEDGGKAVLKITTPDGQVFEKEIFATQPDCITRKVVNVFKDLFDCVDSNKIKGEECTCWTDSSGTRCVSHLVVEGGYSPNSEGYITLLAGDRADKQKIINLLNRRNFDFDFTMVSNPVSGYTCKGNEMSASKEIDLYLLAEYESNPPSALEKNYELFCNDQPSR